MTTVVTTREAEYSPSDLALILASRRAEALPRGSHGRLVSESTNPANQYKYRVGLPATDFAAAALSKAQDDYKKKYPDADMSSLYWAVTFDE